MAGANVGVSKTLMRLLLGRERAEAVRAAQISRSPDRPILVERYLPAFAAAGGRILWVGCRPYTADYPERLERQGAEVWTTDIDARSAAWGRAGRHRTGDLRDVARLFGDLQFDAILCNGVLGWGVDRPGDQAAALTAMAQILKPGGRLLLGWNIDRTPDPLAAGHAARHFEPAPLGDLPARWPVAGVTHVYDLFVRRAP